MSNSRQRVGCIHVLKYIAGHYVPSDRQELDRSWQYFGSSPERECLHINARTAYSRALDGSAMVIFTQTLEHLYWKRDYRTYSADYCTPGLYKNQIPRRSALMKCVRDAGGQRATDAFIHGWTHNVILRLSEVMRRTSIVFG